MSLVGVVTAVTSVITGAIVSVVVVGVVSLSAVVSSVVVVSLSVVVLASVVVVSSVVVEEVSPPLSLLQPINIKNDSTNTVNEKRLERMPFGNFLNLKINIPHLFPP